MKHFWGVEDLCKSWEGGIDKLARGMKTNQIKQAILRHICRTKNWSTSSWSGVPYIKYWNCNFTLEKKSFKSVRNFPIYQEENNVTFQSKLNSHCHYFTKKISGPFYLILYDFPYHQAPYISPIELCFSYQMQLCIYRHSTIWSQYRLPIWGLP